MLNMNNPEQSKLISFISKYPYLIIAVLGLISYFQVVSFGYVNFDDDMQIKSKIEILSDINNLSEAFLTDSFFTKGGYYYRPLMNATFLLDTQVSGESLWMHHTTSLILHILTALALFRLLRVLKFESIPSLFWVSVFAVSPVFSNAVAWLPARNDLLMGLFGLLAFINYLKFQKDGKVLHLVFHVVCIMAAFMSKEIAFLFTIVFTLHTFLFFRNKLFSRNNFILYGSWVILLLTWLYLRSFSIGGGTTRFDPMGINQFLLNLPFIPEIIAKFFLPFLVTTMPTFTPHIYIIGLLFMAGIIYFAIKSKNSRTKYILFAAIFFFLFATPGLIFRYPTAKDYFEYFEARAYLPLIGVIIICLELIPKSLYDLSNNKNKIIMAGIIIALIGINLWKLPNYKNSLTFWKAAVIHNPDRPLYNFHLARNLLRNGKTDIAEKFFLRALKLKPNIPEANYETGYYYFQKGEYSKAIPYFENVIAKESLYMRVLELRYFVKSSYNSLAASHYYLGNNEKAIEYYEIYIKKWPKDLHVIENLLKIYITAEQYTKALELANHYKSLGGGNNIFVQLYNDWAISLFKKRKYAQALEIIDTGLGLNPNNPLLLTNKGRMLSETGKPNEAVKLWEKAIAINGDFIAPYKLLEAFYRKNNDISKADKYKNIVEQMNDRDKN